MVFDLFFQWAHGKNIHNDSKHTEEPWLSNAAAAWVLAKKLRAPAFEKYALVAFIHNCALAAFGPWEYIEKEAPPGSSIRRFSDHWVAWNAHMSGSRPNEFAGLQAVRRTRLVTEKTRDPRIYDIEHWYSRCGDGLNPGCSHDPDARRAELHQRNQKVVLPRESGRSFETKRQGRLNQTSSSSKFDHPGKAFTVVSDPQAQPRTNPLSQLCSYFPDYLFDPSIYHRRPLHFSAQT